MSTSGRYAVARIGDSPAADDNAPAGSPVKGLQEWTCEESVDQLDASDGEGLARNTDGGMPGCRITIKCVQKTATGVPVLMRPGTILSKLVLYYNRMDPKEAAWFFPYAVVISASNPVRVRGQREYTLTIESKGGYYGPNEVEDTAIDTLLADTYVSPDA